MPSSQDHEAALFQLALSKPGAKRAAWLDAECDGDAALRQRLDALLAAHEHPETLLATQAEAARLREDASARQTQPATKLDLADAPDEAVGQTLGRYKLLERVGEGGCGVVYVAEQTEPVRRRVALKVIKLGMDTKQVVARFEAERQALAMMDHPNIAKVLDAGMTGASDQSSVASGQSSVISDQSRGDGGRGARRESLTTDHCPLITGYGRPYFVMELVRGIRITDYCDQANLTTKERLDLFIKVCQAIQHAHQKGIIHRDIKPSNILVTLHDGVPVPKVIDFGIAKATEGRLTDSTVYTQLHQFIGTPAYMSPEQAEMSGLDIDTRSDIYSLGVLLYELLAGSTPFEAKELMASGLDAMRKTIREKEPPRPSTRVAALAADELTTAAKRRSADTSKLLHQLKGDLDWIVMKALEKDRTRRYETANSLARDVQRHLQNEPVTARPPSTAYRFQKLVRRNRLAFGAAAAITGILVLAVIVSAWGAVRATRSRAVAVLAQRNEAKERKAAEEARANEAKERAVAEQRLYDSLVGEARATRVGRRVGYREEVFKLLRQARGLNVPNKSFSDLRREAVACLGDFVGLTPTPLTDFQRNADHRWDLALHPGSRLAAFGSSDGSIQLRELPSGKEVNRLQGERGLRSLSFSPAGDRLVSVHRPGAASMQEWLAGSVVRVWASSPEGHWREAERLPLPGAEQCLASAKGLRISVTEYPSHWMHLLDLDSRAVLHRFEYPKELRGWPLLALSSDDRLLAAETVEGNPNVSLVDIWDLKTGRRERRLDPGLAHCTWLSFSPNGKLFIFTSDSGIALYGTDNFERVAGLRNYFPGRQMICFAPDDDVVGLSLYQEHRVRLWNLARNEDVAILVEPQPAHNVAFTPDGNLLLTGGGDPARCLLYRLKLSEERLSLAGHVASAPGLGFSPDGTRLASVGKERTLKVWDAVSGRMQWEGGPLPGPGQSVAYSPDGRLLATTDFDTLLIWIWDARTGKRLLELGTNAPGYTWSAQFSPDGHLLATAAFDKSPKANASPYPGVSLWTIEPKVVGQPEAGLEGNRVKTAPGQVWNLRFAPDGRRLAFLERSRFYPGELYVWDPNAETSPRFLTKDIIGSGELMSFTADSRHLLCVDTNRSIVTLEVDTGNKVASFPTIDSTGARDWSNQIQLCLSPDGSKLAVSSLSVRGVDVWDPKTGQLLYSLPEQGGTVYWLAWSSDSRRLGVSRSNGDIAIWNLPEISRVLAELGLGP